LDAHRHPVDRIRDPRFSLTIRGYDRHEVDALLADLSKWIDRGDEDLADSERVRERLASVGEQVSAILVEAHDAAREIREEASAQARQSLVGANTTAESLRADADEYAQRVRDEADTHARSARADADAAVERLIAEANGRKQDVEEEISDLEQRRDAVLAELEQLASGLTGTATRHRRFEAAEAAEEREGDESAASTEPAGVDPASSSGRGS
jgi:DivIVA domain-containing protein